MRVRDLIGLLFTLSCLCVVGYAQKPQLKALNVEFMLRGYFYAGTRIQDKRALGGFGSSENFPKTVTGSDDFPSATLSLIALPDVETVFAKDYAGIKVVLANTTAEQKGFAASDSRLYIVQEALDNDGSWKPVEYLPSSWCGNSYHTVFLGPNEYWEFAAPRFDGTQATKLRFKLIIGNGDKATYIYSNDFQGKINPKQFTVQREYTPAGIMDPYNN